jgi:prepilin-type N-terminal cleavage/methylation domain-containing protein
MRTRKPAGFTLPELIVALAVGGMVLLTGRELFGVILDAAGRVPIIGVAADSARNRERLLRELLGRVEAGTDTLRRFDGTPDRARFVSWCGTSDGWLERCSVTLTLVRSDAGALLQAAWPGFQEVLLAGKGPSEIRYLKSAVHGGAWVAQWGDAVSPPLALLILVGKDSMLIRIGARG